jgi:hypothetical protein
MGVISGYKTTISFGVLTEFRHQRKGLENAKKYN